MVSVLVILVAVLTVVFASPIPYDDSTKDSSSPSWNFEFDDRGILRTLPSNKLDAAISVHNNPDSALDRNDSITDATCIPDDSSTNTLDGVASKRGIFRRLSTCPTTDFIPPTKNTPGSGFGKEPRIRIKQPGRLRQQTTTTSDDSCEGRSRKIPVSCSGPMVGGSRSHPDLVLNCVPLLPSTGWQDFILARTVYPEPKHNLGRFCCKNFNDKPLLFEAEDCVAIKDPPGEELELWPRSELDDYIDHLLKIIERNKQREQRQQ